MSRKQLLIIVLLVVANAVILCGGSVFVLNGLSVTAPLSPTAIPVVARFPATYTPSPTPTTPPTQLPPSPTPTSAAVGLITAAMDKARVASSYRLAFDMTMKGDLGSLAPSAGSNAEMSMLNMTGEVSGKDSHFTLKGFVAVFLTGDATKGMEMTEVGGKSYVHGPLPMLGAKDNRWYVLPAGSSSTKSTANPGEMLAMFGDPRSELGKFAKSGAETLDKVRCDVYAADKATALKSFSALSSSSELNQGDFSSLQNNLLDADFRLWVCDDGYVHQIRMGFTAQDPSSSSKTIAIDLSIHLYDFNSKITITAPANAIPASSPFITTSTPSTKPSPTRTRTPTPKK